MLVGLLAVALGGIGIVMPGMPATVFFVVAAWCFSRSSPRLERWLLNLPYVGPLVRDYRSGLGMPRRTKVVAIAMIVVFVSLSVVVFIGSWRLRLPVAAFGAIGIAYIALRVPSREHVLEVRTQEGIEARA